MQNNSEMSTEWAEWSAQQIVSISLRKMKKFIRYLKLKRRRSLDHEEHMKKKQRYEVDYNLEPFAGLTPEYMEMSEWGGKKAF